MNLAAPKPGSVIRYAYLWAGEDTRGRNEARKDRPALVLAISVRTDEGTTQVMVLAITHSQPADPSDAIAIPPAVKRLLGLDSTASWIVTTEANGFIWPGPDVRPVPNRRPVTVIYGQIPAKLLSQVAKSYLANRARQQSRFISRS